MLRVLSICSQTLIIASVIIAIAGCGSKASAVNEKVTKENSERIRPNGAKLAEAEEILGPGMNYSDPTLAAGFKSKKWGPGKNGEEIVAVYKRTASSWR